MKFSPQRPSAEYAQLGASNRPGAAKAVLPPAEQVPPLWTPSPQPHLPAGCDANEQNRCRKRSCPLPENVASGTNQALSGMRHLREQRVPWRSALDRADAFARLHAVTIPRAVFLSAHWNFIRLPVQQLKKPRQNQTPLRPRN